MYSAIIVTVTCLRKHNNADRLQCMEICGQNVIVDNTCKIGQRMVYFPAGGLLDQAFARENNIPRRVRAIRLRGEVSEGIALPIEALSKYTDIRRLRDGDKISTLDDFVLCRMFYPQDEMEIDMKTFTLVRYRGRRHDIRIVRIPWGVEKIGPNAFCYSERVKGVLLPDTVTEIGESAFCCCRYLEMAEIPGSVRTIDRCAFEKCKNLTNLTIHPGVRVIHSEAFRECSGLTSICLPDSIEMIWPMAFYLCSGLRTIQIPKETYTIGDLLDIPNLESVTIDEKNQYFALIDGVLFDKTGSTLLRYPEWKRDEKYVVPDGVKTIQKEAFIENNHLEEVIISNSVTCIRDRAFLNCRNLTRITIPPSVTEIGSNLFFGIHNVSNLKKKRIRGKGKINLDFIIGALDFYAAEDGVLIRGKKKSTAWWYAKREGCAFEGI